MIIALTKGRILEETLPLFERAGIVPCESLKKSRKLLFETNINNVQFMLLRGSDVATYVEFGSADMGVVGKDLILEHGSEGFYEPLDLGIAQCRLMTAVRSDRKITSGRISVATKYINIAKQYFADQGKQIELIKLNGALELAPALGLADAIVDIVDTGKTLKIVKEIYPKAHFATVYAKPKGKEMVDTYITEVSQDTWIFFPWDMALQYVAPYSGND